MPGPVSTFTRLQIFGQVVEEERDRNVEDAAEFVEPTRPDAIGATFVFLDLLKGETHGVAELFLAHPEQGAAQPDPAANVNVNWIGDACREPTSLAGTGFSLALHVACHTVALIWSRFGRASNRVEHP